MEVNSRDRKQNVTNLHSDSMETELKLTQKSSTEPNIQKKTQFFIEHVNEERTDLCKVLQNSNRSPKCPVYVPNVITFFLFLSINIFVSMGNCVTLFIYSIRFKIDFPVYR